MRVLILGGTTEASDLARELAHDRRFSPVLSLAGRTSAPALPDLPCRIGGFDGADGLAAWIAQEQIGAIVDATHPFAARISANAVEASRMSGVPLVSLVRPPWARQAGDCWTAVGSAGEAALELGPRARRVFLTIGRQELATFRAAPQHRYLVRTIDAPDVRTLPPLTKLILQRGPFDIRAEMGLLQEHAIEVLVTKNAGGNATYAKIAAARQLSLPVTMIERPPKPTGRCVCDVQAALHELRSSLPDHGRASSERGV
jgi:precorrin-6A/cobalt-precorrin-6A reductase